MRMIDSINATRSQYDADVKRIRSNAELSPEGKTRRLTELYREAKKQHDTMLRAYRTERETEAAQARATAFGPGFAFGMTEAEKETVRMSYRQALATAGATKDAAELRHLRERATVTGDKLLARATLAIAHERGDRTLLREAGEADPAYAEVLAHLEDGESAQQRVFESIMVRPPERPNEIPLNAEYLPAQPVAVTG